MQIFLKYYGPAFLWALSILIMCSVKLGSLGNSSMFFPGFDKLVHCGFFFVLVIFCCIGLIRQQMPQTLSYKAVIIITISAILYGGVIELLQLYIFTWRSGEWGDLFADTVGACMAAFSILLVVKEMAYVKK